MNVSLLGTGKVGTGAAEIVLRILFDPPSVKEVYAGIEPKPGQVFAVIEMYPQ